MDCDCADSDCREEIPQNRVYDGGRIDSRFDYRESCAEKCNCKTPTLLA